MDSIKSTDLKRNQIIRYSDISNPYTLYRVIGVTSKNVYIKGFNENSLIETMSKNETLVLSYLDTDGFNRWCLHN